MTTTTVSAEVREATAEREELVARTLRAENRVLRETLEIFDNYVDPLDAYREEGELWDTMQHPGCSAAAGALSGFRSEAELAAARNACRALAMTNEFAINGHENRVSYIVGSGHRYQAAPRKAFSASALLASGGRQTPDEFAQEGNVNVHQGADAPRSPARRSAELVAAAQAILDEFVRESGWQRRQQEIVRRRDRDGEAFLRFFLDAEGKTRVRFVEPWQVTEQGVNVGRIVNPSDNVARMGGRSDTPSYMNGRIGNPSYAFGIATDPDDVETVLGYWLDDGEYVPAAEMQHRKANVDANVRRGVPLFYPVRRNLARAEKLLRNMAAVSDIQTAIALIRKHRAGGRSSIEQLRTSLASASSPAAGSSRAAMTYYQPFQPGTILDVHSDAEYDFPARGLDASRYVLVLQAILRAVASRLVMPEFMLTSDASNANYSSTLVAEGPAVKMFERLQHDMIVDDLEVMWRVLRGAVNAGRLDAAALDLIDIQVEPPKIAVRDRLQEAQVDEILVRNGAMSVQRMAMRHGLDPEVERGLMGRRQGEGRSANDEGMTNA